MYSAFKDFPSWSLDKSSSILERASLLSCRMSPLKCLVCPMKSALRSTTRYLNTRRSYAKDYETYVRGWFPYQGLRHSPPMLSCFWDFGLLRARIAENVMWRKPSFREDIVCRWQLLLFWGDSDERLHMLRKLRSRGPQGFTSGLQVANLRLLALAKGRDTSAPILSSRPFFFYSHR